MKKILSSILLSTMISCASQIPTTEIKEQLSYNSLPKEYKEYKKGKIIDFGWKEFSEGKVCEYHEWDINNDGKSEVIELYIERNDKPIAYGFDLNKNNSFECDEILTDREMDGLNSNEKTLAEEACRENSIFI